MPLIESIPKTLEEVLRASDLASDELSIAASADLTLRGEFGESWLAISREKLLVFEMNGAEPEPLVKIDLKDIHKTHVDSLVGGSALVASVNGTTMELVRYTNALQGKFARIARFLGEVAEYHRQKENGESEKDFPQPEDSPDDERTCPNCELPLLSGTKVCPACVSKGQAIIRLLGYLKPYWKQTTLVWLMMLGSTCLNLVPPYLTLPMVDKVLAPKDAAFTVAQRLSLLGWLVVGLLSVRIVVQVVDIVRGRMLVWLGTRISHDLRSKVYQHIQLLSLRFFDKQETGAMIARITQDTQSVEEVIVLGAQHLVINVLTLMGITVVLLVMNWKLTLLVMLPIPLVMFLSQLFWKRVKQLWGRFWHARQKLSAAVNDSISGIRVVKAFGREHQESDRFDDRSMELLVTGKEAQRTWVSFFPILGFITSSGLLIVWYVGGREVVQNELSLGTLMAFIAYLAFFYTPLQFLTRVTDYLARALTASERVFEILDSEPDVQDVTNPVTMPRIEGRVQFEEVTFGYDKNKPVLNKLDLHVQPGEMIGLIGHSGAGKTTTINLICRFYDVDEGRILIDGVDIRNIPQHDVRSQIGVVLQDTFLFNGTIAENIAYAKSDATLEEIMRAARAANAHSFIVQKPDGYDTRVGERGQSLSGGERQRVAIARAILHDPRILILDEATSSVDADTEMQIQDAIARLVKGRTTFAIAHRLSTLRNANRLVVLKDGKIEEVGTHDELMEKEGEFHRLINMQQEISSIRAVPDRDAPHSYPMRQGFGSRRRH